MRFEDLPELDITNPENFDDLPGSLDWSLYPDGLARSSRGLEILGHRQLGEAYRSADLRNSTEARMAGLGITEGPVYEAVAGMTTSTEGSEHRRMRRAFQPWFIDGNVEKFRAEIRSTVERWLIENSSGTVDFAGELGAQLPSVVFARIVGADVGDAQFITRVSAQILRFTAANRTVHDVVNKGVLDMLEWLEVLIERKLEHPGSDLTSALLQAERDGTITRAHTHRILVTLVIASVDSTRAQMSCNIAALARNKDQWRLLKEHSEAVPNAVLELYRHSPAVLSLSRYAERPIELYGLQLAPFVTVYLDGFAANNDPSVYDRPRQLDVRKVRDRPSFSFGNGRHSCVGRMLATIEQEELLRGMLAYWDDFEVAEATFIGMPYVRGPGTLLLSVSRRDEGRRIVAFHETSR